jgi:hypothetical protein
MTFPLIKFLIQLRKIIYIKIMSEEEYNDIILDEEKEEDQEVLL